MKQDIKVGAPKPKGVPSMPSPSDPFPRGLRITRDLPDMQSLTNGCPKCEEVRRDDDSKTAHHNRECRTRSEAEMAPDIEEYKKSYT